MSAISFAGNQSTRRSRSLFFSLFFAPFLTYCCQLAVASLASSGLDRASFCRLARATASRNASTSCSVGSSDGRLLCFSPVGTWMKENCPGRDRDGMALQFSGRSSIGVLDDCPAWEAAPPHSACRPHSASCGK